MLAITITLSFFPISVHAISPGDSVDYTHSGPKATFYSGEYIGKCCQAGVEAGDSGTAKIDAEITNETLRKLAYHFTYVERWFDKTDIHPSYSATTYAQIHAYAIQYAWMGEAAFRQGAGKVFTSNAVDKFCQTAEQMITASANTEVPSNFKMYHLVEPSSDKQDFMLWRLEPQGKLKLSKHSSLPGITE